MKLNFFTTFLILLLLLSSCLEKGDEVSVSLKKGGANTENNSNNDGEEVATEEGSNSNNESSSSNNQNVTITPKGSNAGDSINLSTDLAKLVTISNISSVIVSGQLSISGTSDLELVTIDNCSYSGDDISYTLNANESAKFMVVRSSNFSSSISANLQNTINSNTNNTAITTNALGYEFIFWFNPKDLEISNLASDADSSGDVSNGDTINTLTDRSGNNFILSASNSTSYATVISNGSNGQRNIQMNSYYLNLSTLYGTSYSGVFGNLGFPSDGSRVLYILSHQLTTVNSSKRFHLMTHLNGGAATTYFGPDLNTSVPTQSGKYGFYANRNAFETTSTTPTTPFIYSLYFTNTAVGSSISLNTSLYFNNDLLGINNSNQYTSGGNQFSSTISDSNTILLVYEAKLHDIMIVKGVDTEAKRLDLLCYNALKNGISVATCN